MTCPNQSADGSDPERDRRGAFRDPSDRAASPGRSPHRRTATASAPQPPWTPGAPRLPAASGDDRNFLTLWSGQAFSQFGSQIQELAIPVLAVLILNATELQVGVLSAAGVAAFLVVGPPGRGVDRPDAQAPRHDLGGRRPRARARVDSAAVVARRAADVAPVCRRPHRRHRDGLLRRVVSEPDPVARASEPDRRGQRQAAGDVRAGEHRRSGDRRLAGRHPHRAARDPRRPSAPT